MSEKELSQDELIELRRREFYKKAIQRFWDEFAAAEALSAARENQYRYRYKPRNRITGY